MYDGKPYEPVDYHKGEWQGSITLRQAMAKSLNVPTVEVAEMIGYRNVATLAHNAGLNSDIRPTPAMALGAYDVTPMEILGAYTVFANNGVWLKPRLIDRVRDKAGAEIWEGTVEQKKVLDPTGELPDGESAAGGPADRHGRRRARAGDSSFRRPARPVLPTTPGSPDSRPNCCAWSG